MPNWGFEYSRSDVFPRGEPEKLVRLQPHGCLLALRKRHFRGGNYPIFKRGHSPFHHCGLRKYSNPLRKTLQVILFHQISHLIRFSINSLLNNMNFLTARHRGLRGRGMGLGGILSPFDFLRPRGFRDPLGLHPGHPHYGLECDGCTIGYDGEHLCSCSQLLELMVQAQLQEIMSAGVSGCGCPECPLERYGYGYGGGGYGGYSQ